MAAKNDYFKAMSKICTAFGMTGDSDELLNLVVRSAAEAMKAKAACLYMPSEEEDEYVAVAHTGLSERYLKETHKRVEHTMKLLKEKNHIHFRDAKTDPRVRNRESKIAEGIGSILIVPVMVKGRMIGNLALYTSEIRDFSKKEIEFLSILAEQGGTAIENARLVEKIREQTRIFHVLTASIMESRDIKQILQTLTADIAKAIGVKAASIRLLDDARVTLKLAASYGLSEKYLNKGPISAEKSIAEALKGKPVVVKDAAKDSGVQYRDEKKEERIVSILCVPIKSKEEVFGVLRLYSATEREFTEDEIEFVTALAYLGGVAIQNVNLYAMLKSDIKDLRDDFWIFKTWY
ncbi:MAG: GAF domain-containing protein [Deltaproteobacteria bacterium]|nr:GAF domain-containing protein [Deltaproteobacteria bacterium]